MIFYKRFIGAIQAKTGHLTLSEFGAYDRLLDHCYSTEQPLPLDIGTCCRIARAVTPAEKKAVASVLAQFFVEQDGGYVQQRALEVMAEAQPKIVSARENGKHGGRPKKNRGAPPNETEPATQTEPNGFQNENPMGFQTETEPATQTEPNGKARQRQITILSQDRVGELKKESAEEAHGSRARGSAGGSPGSACRAMREAGLADVNPSHPKLAALLEAGVTGEELRDAAAHAVERGKGFTYALGTAEGRRRDAANTAPLPPRRDNARASAPALSFAERDRVAGWRKWERMTGGRHPELDALRQSGLVDADGNIVGAGTLVIDVTPAPQAATPLLEVAP